jgi:hypothetical protein
LASLSQPVAKEITMQINRRFAIRALQLLVICSAAAVLLAAVPVSTDKSAMPAVGSLVPATAATAGTFTGQYENGIPVYRLPPISITVDRKSEMARIEREDRLAAAWQPTQTATPAAPRASR